jgi:hypothetical protein
LTYIQEYGNGRLPKKHSTFFASMMRELNLSDEPEAYLDTVPWQVGGWVGGVGGVGVLQMMGQA